MVLILALGLQFLLPYKGAAPESGGLAVRRPRPVTIPLLPEYTAILSAPIFAPDRKPGEAGASDSGGGTLAAYAALGSVAGRGVASGVVSGAAGGAKTLKLGDTLEGWRLAQVTTTKLVFERNGVRHTLVIGEPAEALSKASPTDAPEAGQ